MKLLNKKNVPVWVRCANDPKSFNLKWVKYYKLIELIKINTDGGAKSTYARGRSGRMEIKMQYILPFIIREMSYQYWFLILQGTVIGITQPPPRDGAWSALFSNLSKSALDDYVVKCSERPLLEEVAWSRLLCPI